MGKRGEGIGEKDEVRAKERIEVGKREKGRGGRRKER